MAVFIDSIRNGSWSGKISMDKNIIIKINMVIFLHFDNSGIKHTASGIFNMIIVCGYFVNGKL